MLISVNSAELIGDMPSRHSSFHSQLNKYNSGASQRRASKELQTNNRSSMPALHRLRDESNEKSQTSLLPSLMQREGGKSQSKLSFTGSKMILGTQPKLTRDAYGLNDHKGTFSQKKQHFSHISVRDMLTRDAKTQFESTVPKHHMPDVSKAIFEKPMGVTGFGVAKVKIGRETFI